KRRRPGRILPKTNERGGKSAAEAAVSQAADQTIDQLRNKNSNNYLSDMLAVAGGTNYKDQLKKMENDLKSSQRAKELEKELKAKEKEWKKRIDGLPKESEIKQLSEKVKKFKFNSKNPAEIKKSLKALDNIYKEARQKYKTVEGAKKSFDADFKKYNSEFKSIEQMVQKDINDITRKLNIPSLDPKELTQMLLGNMVANQLGSIMKYKDVAREYMPAANSKEERKAKKLTTAERANGVNFKYMTTTSYPLFWLKKAQISSKSGSAQEGDLTGTLMNVTDAPKHIKKPATLHFEGGFPNSQIYDVVGDVVVDHTTDNPKESATFTVGKFPVDENTFSKSEDVTFGYKKADGKSQIKVLLENQTVNIASQSLFTNVDYFVDSKDSRLKGILEGITKDLNDLTLNVRAKGSWDDLKLNMNSNLGQKLSNAIKAQLEAQVKKAKQDVEQHVRGLVDGEKAKLQGEIGKLEKQLGVSLKSREAAMNSVKSEVDKKKKESVNKEKKKAQKKLEKEAKKLFKGIKF
ncbi:MAG: TIGR03545 family protein, partial [Bdellovibrionales bacterium]|nr:TIGR03545 family protein [Bdellovibrionales bacterium]NQZ18947.1 TIGR03545 family protein [Bdellovibrionales bacterium]